LKQRLTLLQIPTSFTGQGVLLCGPVPPEQFSTGPFDFKRLALEKGLDLKKGTKYLRDELLREVIDNFSGGKVKVVKTGRGKLSLEGTPGETYFAVRKVVYSLHAKAG